MCNNNASRWEERLGDALLAYRTSVSTTTGYTPFFLLYGRRSRMPLTELLRADPQDHLGGRLYDLAEALKVAKAATEDSRKYNRERLINKANLGLLTVGDSVVLAAQDRVAMTSRWDPHWEVTRGSGPVVYVRNQLTGKHKPVNREKVRLVDPTIAWDVINPRPRKQIRWPRRGLGRAGGDEPLAPPLQAPHPGPREQAPGGALSSDDDNDAPNGDTRGEGCDQPAARAVPPDTTPLGTGLGTRTDLDATPPVRPHRQLRLSRRAHESAHQADDELAVDPVVSHYRKRERGWAPPSPVEAKRVRVEVVEHLCNFLQTEHRRSHTSH